mmetsp:Transcript_123058/g.359249  ORF Transcript_123058/g.359249 Transcript_123058/m.359249 type:complete len:361 (-) Transcript_123058:201-1283(-)
MHPIGVRAREVAAEGVGGAVEDELCQRHSCARCELDTERVEASGDVHVVGAGHAPDDRHVVRGVRVRAVEPRLHAHLGEGRHVYQGVLEPGAGLLQRRFVELVLRVAGAEDLPGVLRAHALGQVVPRVALEDAQAEAAGLRLQVVLMEDVPDNRQMAAGPFNLLKDQVLVGYHGNGDPVLAEGAAAQLLAPGPSAEHHVAAGDLLAGPRPEPRDLHRRGIKVHLCTLGVLEQLRAVAARLLGHPHGHIRWVHEAVFGRVDPTNDAVELQERMDGRDLLGRHEPVVRAADAARHLDVAREALHGVMAPRERQRAAACPAHCAVAGLVLHTAVELGGVARQRGLQRTALKGAHEARGVPGGA